MKLVASAAALLFAISLTAHAVEDASDAYIIDLPTTLRLAGARNIDIQLAREKLAEARATQESAIEKFFPSAAPGITYRRHDNLIQNTEGVIEDVHKQSYAPGGTIIAQTDLGDAIFKSLAAHQLVKAAGHAFDAQREDSIVSARRPTSIWSQRTAPPVSRAKRCAYRVITKLRSTKRSASASHSKATPSA